ncbi:MAG: sppA1 [Rickettsiaceae bacterium]|jgi:signal peptide peptidase SppA|nr:sppA1 [Rickettsiaceae bacterium]
MTVSIRTRKTTNLNTASAIIDNKYSSSKLDQLLSFLPFEKFRNPPATIGVIRLAGAIGSAPQLRSGLSLEGLNSTIEDTFKLPRLKAVCLSINSPGGSPVQSELIANRIRELAEEHKIPVYSFIEDVGASGGYWLACIGDEIYASKSSIIGSIGVVSAGFGFNEAIKRLGVERRLYTQGKNKSLLDPFSPERKEDVDIIKKIQSDIHQHFIDYVKERRRNRITQVDELIYTGEVWAGEIAKDFGLIDGIDNLYSFVRKKFGKNINIKHMNQKQSWLKRRLGLSLGSPIDELISYIEGKIQSRKIGL